MRKGSAQVDDADGCCEGGETIDAIMSEEINTMEGQCNDESDHELMFAKGSGGNQDIDSLFEIMDQIRRELMEEEQKMMTQYEDLERFDDDHLCAAIECLQTNALMCPICQRYNLQQSTGFIFCRCGVQINSQNDGINLDHLRTQLDFVTSSHSDHCSSACSFAMSLRGASCHLQTIVATCQACDFMEVVI